MIKTDVVGNPALPPHNKADGSSYCTETQFQATSGGGARSAISLALRLQKPRPRVN